jgi:hypothetical protein
VTRTTHRRHATISLISLILLGACSNAAPSSREPSVAPSLPASGESSPSASALPTPAPSGFAFSDEAVIGYYESRGFTCDEPQPSAAAVGYLFQGCTMLRSDGRTLAIGLVADPMGELADAFASVQGSPDEPILDPTAALDHLSGFLGATLGDERGTSLLEWLAGHVGDAYAQTTVDVLVVATYTQSETDHSRLYLELANQDYIEAPVPSAS